VLRENVSSAENQQERSHEIGNYIAGFVDGEGSFNVSLRRNDTYLLGWQVVLSFNVSQKEVTVLNLIKDTLGCGIIKTRKCDGIHSLDITKPYDVVNKVIPFFDQYGFFSLEKEKNYEIFKEISFLAYQKPLSPLLFIKILQLREDLNKGKGRKRKYTINNVFEKSSETIRQASINLEDDIVRPVWRYTEPSRNV
jgi:hypothetical protein